VLQIEAGTTSVWKGFKLLIPEPLEFKISKIYKLEGANGSGKSSFIKHFILPTLKQNKAEHYILYIEQQMHKEFYAIKADAAIKGYRDKVDSEKAAIDYLLQDLKTALAREQRSVVAVLDETIYLDEIVAALQLLCPKLLLIFCDHRGQYSTVQDATINFKPLSVGQSEIYEATP